MIFISNSYRPRIGRAGLHEIVPGTKHVMHLKQKKRDKTLNSVELTADVF